MSFKKKNLHAHSTAPGSNRKPRRTDISNAYPTHKEAGAYPAGWVRGRLTYFVDFWKNNMTKIMLKSPLRCMWEMHYQFSRQWECGKTFSPILHGHEHHQSQFSRQWECDKTFAPILHGREHHQSENKERRRGRLLFQGVDCCSTLTAPNDSASRFKSAHTLIAESVTACEEERGADNYALIPN